ncbi:MAG: 1-acyl-sn-glycerol-3-phosphate acyltransferase [Massilibacteroides sp.]|nr:1-acyl-sn-glycerol-3-phosphate acyltransferase [Massilibacteroides sp.]MDD3063525.1 1-acyl-sn-glycerol-3-phosphate acyltransferase [Massilibacteroides sp.]MDD4115333.1 1-acyl-sn-glycerol-3-phosphate acyltransferase [Massilibacteroides sp.]MDD4660769.1 1-acyl-sn-glycerol-3-phosphate acyltransferase [Massilibacteroides sp.]
MKKVISKTLLKLIGWKAVPIGKYVPKCVICVAPHTSNWDFILGKLFYLSLGRKANFLIKKEWFFFPLNFLFNWMGGVPVDRNKKTSVTDQMVKAFNKRKQLHLAVTPEGTRQRVEEWKKGFYFMALNANIPILLAYFDYKKKEVGFKEMFYPTGNATEDILKIRSYYNDVTARHPENFVKL